MLPFTLSEFEDRAVIMCAALVIDAFFGEPDWLWRRLPHPVVLFGKMIGTLEHYGNQRRLRGRQRRFCGLITILVCCVIAFAAANGLSVIGSGAELVALAILLAGRSLHTHVKAVADALDYSLDAARQSIGMIVGRRTTSMTQSEICRATIETDAENLSDGVIAPAFWFLVLGLPGVFIYKMVNTADSMIGYKNARYYAFGWAAAKLDDALNYLPARLTGILLVLASFGGTGGAMAALTTMLRDAPKHASPNAGWPEAAMAGGLGIWLAGPRYYGNRIKNADKFNSRGRDAQNDDIAAALGISMRAIGLFWVMVAIIGLPALQNLIVQLSNITVQSH